MLHYIKLSFQWCKCHFCKAFNCCQINIWNPSDHLCSSCICKEDRYAIKPLSSTNRQEGSVLLTRLKQPRIDTGDSTGVFTRNIRHTKSVQGKQRYKIRWCLSCCISERIESRGRVVSNLSSQSGGPGSTSRTGDRLSWLRFLWFSSVSPLKCRDSTLN
jgi:hypothetical protein